MVSFAVAAIYRQKGIFLTELQQCVLRECWQDQRKTYDCIALNIGYSPNYLKKKVIPELWNLLSETFGQKVTKANSYKILKECRESISGTTGMPPKLEPPEGPVPLGSPFYIARPVLEGSLYEEIRGPGALIRLKGPRKIGKTTLLARILAYAEKQGYHTVRLNLNRADSGVLSSPNRFFRWLCANAARQLELEAGLKDYWDEDLGALSNCYFYLEKYLLPQIEHPIVLGLDEENRLVEHPAVARDFFALLRSWYEDAKYSPVWHKLRIVTCNFSDAGINLESNQWPLNAGTVVDLPPFRQMQVEDLVRRHGLALSSWELSGLESLLGGFPYLIRKLFYEAARYEKNWRSLVAGAATDTGIFRDHLQELLLILQQMPELLEAYWQVVTAETPMALDLKLAFPLKSLGLVCFEEERVRASCELYGQYFRDRLL